MNLVRRLGVATSLLSLIGLVGCGDARDARDDGAGATQKQVASGLAVATDTTTVDDVTPVATQPPGRAVAELHRITPTKPADVTLSK